ncbi:hypothetical protein KJ059_13870 [Myxococcota bacterium]|nr:hypothetical protein [Myxococcota bacterium]MCZ7616846.1 hypothetical protein [Myxococcota bacterium]
MAARVRWRLLPLLVVVSGLLAGSAAHAILAGDLLVTDRTNGRVLAVRPGTGAVWVISPRAGGADLLVEPAGIVMTDFGVIVVVDEATSQLVAIDPATGDQSVVQETGGSAPLAVGSAPFGLALRQTEGAYEMWISARGSNEIRHVIGLEGFGIASATLSADARWSDARGVAVAGDQLLVAVGDGQGYWKVNLATGAISDPLLEYDSMFPELPPIDHSPGVPAWDVEPYQYEVKVNVFDAVTFHTVLSLQKRAEPFFLTCDAAGTRITAYGTLYKPFDPIDPKSFAKDTVEVADGTPLHCPTALATGLDGLLYVLDTSFPFGGDPAIVRVAPGSGTDPIVVASLSSFTIQPMGLAVAPISIPEPSAGTGAIALGVLLLLARRSRSLRSR